MTLQTQRVRTLEQVHRVATGEEPAGTAWRTGGIGTPGARPAAAGGRGTARLAGENPTKRVPFSFMSITIRPVSPAAGAETGGVDLSRPLRDLEFEAVCGALLTTPSTTTTATGG